MLLFGAGDFLSWFTSYMSQILLPVLENSPRISLEIF